MALVFDFGFKVQAASFSSKTYATGPILTFAIGAMQDPFPGEAPGIQKWWVVNCSLSQVQNSRDGPLGAAVGLKDIRIVGIFMPGQSTDLGNDPFNWEPITAGFLTSIVVAVQANKGEMTGSVNFRIWQ